MTPETLRNLRLLTLGNSNDESRDELLELLYGYAEARFGLILDRARKLNGIVLAEGEAEIPEELVWILDEVTVKRFNRIGSEGMSSESVAGHSIAFDADAFCEYATIIDDYFNPDIGGIRPGKVVVY
jgi:hypothetical protein